jgi:hypothetical protein
MDSGWWASEGDSSPKGPGGQDTAESQQEASSPQSVTISSFKTDRRKEGRLPTNKRAKHCVTDSPDSSAGTSEATALSLDLDRDRHMLPIGLPGWGLPPPLNVAGMVTGVPVSFVSTPALVPGALSSLLSADLVYPVTPMSRASGALAKDLLAPPIAKPLASVEAALFEILAGKNRGPPLGLKLNRDSVVREMNNRR